MVMFNDCFLVICVDWCYVCDFIELCLNYFGFVFVDVII